MEHKAKVVGAGNTEGGPDFSLSYDYSFASPAQELGAALARSNIGSKDVDRRAVSCILMIQAVLPSRLPFVASVFWPPR